MGFLLLIAAGSLPANSAFAQMSQQDYLRQHAGALKAQMVRAQIEQAAAPGFAQEAYDAQQAYLRDTAEKSFRIGKPQTTKSHLVSGQADSYQAPPAMPPVHVAPNAYSVPPQRMAQRISPPPVQHPPSQPSAYAPPARSVAAMPQGYPNRALPPRTISDLPSPAELGDQGESISGPGNRVGLQDRLTSFLAKPKNRSTSKLPVPQFAETTQEQHAAAPTPARRRPRVQQTGVEQPFFAPETRSFEAAELPTPSGNQIDDAAYERMAAAITKREVGRAVAYEENHSDSDVVQVAMAVPTPQDMGFTQPPRHQQPSVPTLYEPTPARNLAKPTAAKQISVLNTSQQQQGDDSNAFGIRQGDDDDAAIDQLRYDNAMKRLPRPSAGSSSRFDSLRANLNLARIDDDKDQNLNNV